MGRKKRGTKSHSLKIEVSKNQLIEVLKRERFSIKENFQGLEIQKRLSDSSRLHGTVKFNPRQKDKAVITLHEDVYPGFPFAHHIVRFPSNRTKKALFKIQQNLEDEGQESSPLFIFEQSEENKPCLFSSKVKKTSPTYSWAIKL